MTLDPSALRARCAMLEEIVAELATSDPLDVDRYAGCEQIRGWDCRFCGYGWRENEKPTVEAHADSCAYRRAVDATRRESDPVVYDYDGNEGRNYCTLCVSDGGRPTVYHTPECPTRREEG